MSIVREITRAIRVVLVLWVLTAVVYPAIALWVGQKFFPYQAGGSLVQNLRGKVVGSALIGQPFSTARYFHGRPSTINYSTANPKKDQNNVLKTGISGASNLAPSNTKKLLKDHRKSTEPDLLKRIRSDMDKLQKAGITPTADLVYASGSGLDPHITKEAASAQVERVARARGLSNDLINSLIDKHTQDRFLWIFGEPGVNVLNLNRELDVQQAPRR